MDSSRIQRDVDPIAAAQTMYASGDADPRDAAADAGKRKIPPPTVTLTMLAASPQTPTARINAPSPFVSLPATRRVLVPVGLDQAWNVFAPDPRRQVV